MKKLYEIKIGQTINNYFIESYAGIIERRKSFNCICKCGKKEIITGTKLRTNSKKQCKDCSFKQRELNKKQVSQLQQMYNHRIICRCRTSNIENKLSIEEFEILINKNCFYCGIKPQLTSKFKRNKYINTEDFKMNGIDRIDSNLGYSKENCVTCCLPCNIMKMDMSLINFKKRIMKIYKNLKM